MRKRSTVVAWSKPSSCSVEGAEQHLLHEGRAEHPALIAQRTGVHAARAPGLARPQLQQQPLVDVDRFKLLNDQFGHLCTKGTIERAEPSTIELREHDEVGLARIAFTFAKHGFGDLRNMIDSLNSFVTPHA